MKFMLLLAIGVFVTGCQGGTAETPESLNDATDESNSESTARGPDQPATEDDSDLHHYFHSDEEPFEAHWSYAGDNGPGFWGTLDPSYKLAKSGQRQSPIDISEARQATLTALEFDYRQSKIHIVYNGHAIQQNEGTRSFLKVGEQLFRLHQFHFHCPSEHTVNGKHFALEMHLVHKDEAGRIAVVALLFEEGDANSWLGPIWDFLPTRENRRRDINIDINVADVLPQDHSYYFYSGSLTTPPCSEDVQWFVLETPVSLSKDQLAAFTRVIDHNNRPIQPLNGRTIEATR